jgi:deoxyribodipyrimidine photolyase-related protein
MNPLTYDSDNRDPFDDLSGVDRAVFMEHKDDQYKKAVKYVQNKFAHNPGELSYWLPGDHQEAVKYLHDFFKYRFHNFGQYEDAIHPDALFGYHSVMSPIINIGLLTPDFIISEVKRVYKKYPFPSVEGFIRQIIGWREYCRFIYVTDGPVYGNRFGANKKLPDYWYSSVAHGATEVDYRAVWGAANTTPDIIIRLILKAWKIGYLHHIERLMVITNYLTYTEIRPDHCYKWFMSAFLDSYHIFMDTNLYGMGMDVIDKTKKYTCPYRLPKNWVTEIAVNAIEKEVKPHLEQQSNKEVKPHLERQSNKEVKPPGARHSPVYMTNRMYICSSNYMKKMGWPITPKDKEIIDELYRRFVKKHKKYLASNYANARNVAHIK